MTVQSIVLRKSAYNLEQANEQVRKMGHNVKYLNKNVTEYKAGQTINYWRYRQISPLRFDKKSFTTKKINDNLYLIIGELKK